MVDDLDQFLPTPLHRPTFTGTGNPIGKAGKSNDFIFLAFHAHTSPTRDVITKKNVILCVWPTLHVRVREILHKNCIIGDRNVTKIVR